MSTLRVVNKYWLKTRLGQTLIVTLGADDPEELEKRIAKNLADKTAKKAGFEKFVRIGDTFINGQNELPTKKFYYKGRKKT